MTAFIKLSLVQLLLFFAFACFLLGKVINQRKVGLEARYRTRFESCLINHPLFVVGKDLFCENYTYTVFFSPLFIFTHVGKEDMAF